MRRLGIDFGSLFISFVLLEDGRITRAEYRERKGAVIEELERIWSDAAPDAVGITGHFPRSPKVFDSTLCVIRGAAFLLPGCRNVLSIGGQSFMLVVFDEHGAYREHVLNPPCAAGTGSFLEQQAERLGLTPHELSEHARTHQGAIPSIATRCAVFAKSDIIHSMQEGHSVGAICAGLCDGMGRSVIDALVKGRPLTPPVGLVGGVAQNDRLVSSIRTALGLPVVVPERPWAAGAIGAALLASSREADLTVLRPAKLSRNRRPTLELRLSDYPAFETPRMVGDVEVVGAASAATSSRALALGIDIGSTSTKAALLDERGQVVAGLYTATKGEPVLAVQSLLRALDASVPGWASELAHTATTGSGRRMIKELFRADFEINEVTAHARAACLLHPEVDTIIEIGGQDSKFARIREGQAVHSVMNYVCAAGTGSFIEEQARRLGVPLHEVSDLALGHAAPYTSDRCTVYMERDLNLLLAEGWSRPAVLAAVLFSVRDNYLSKVVGRHPVGRHVVFQGATARNKALVAAFEQGLDKPIHVSPYCHLAGAMGAALLARESGAAAAGFRAGEVRWNLERELCELCTNRCTMTVVRGEDGDVAWGMKCGRDYDERRKKLPRAASAFERRVAPPALEPHQGARGTIGLADALYHKEFNPLWNDFFRRLGLSVVTASGGRKLLDKGKPLVNSDFCAPIILAHGAIRQLNDRGVDAIFFPSLLNDQDPSSSEDVPFKARIKDSCFCYYSQYAPVILSHLTALSLEDRLIAPTLCLRTESPVKVASTLFEHLVRRFPDLRQEQVTEHFLSAWEAHQERRRALKANRPALRTDAPNLVLVGRPYVALEKAIHLGIPGQLEELGAQVLWQDELDTVEESGPPHDRMHWNYGRKILQAASWAARTPGCYVVYLSCFRCSPDSFLVGYVRDLMEAAGKPMLVLQLDEHASDVGYTTRIEAALRTFEAHRGRGHARPPARKEAEHDALSPGDAVLVPYINGLVSALWSACFRVEGFPSYVLDNSDEVIHTGYQYAQGGECMPAVAIAGGAIRKVREVGLEPRSTLLYVPTLCMGCNFPQFPVMAGQALRAAGVQGVKVPAIHALNPAASLPGILSMKLFETSVIASVLNKVLHRVKPYEAVPGSASRAFGEARELMLEAIRRREGLRKPFARAVQMLRDVPRQPHAPRKPRIGVLGDFYVKYNEVVNQNVTDLIEQLGGEVVIPSLTDTTSHFLDVDIRAGFERPEALQVLQSFEARYEKVAEDLLGDTREPPWSACAELLEKHRIPPSMAGETSINVGRALYLLEHRLVDALVHLNPMFCCPGVVSSSLFRKLQAEFSVPIVDIFYDGTGDPNSVLIPHLAWLQTEPRA